MTGLLLFAVSTASAFEFIDVCNGQPTRWEDLPTVWQLDVSNGQVYTGLPDGEVRDAIQAGFDVWSSPSSCCSSFAHLDGGTTTGGLDDNDEVNAIFFEEDAWDPALGDGTIAITRVQWNRFCVIDAVDQVYNAVNFAFTTTSDPGSIRTDLQSIAAHENGHWLGLDHTGVRAATMFATYRQGTSTLRTLDPDDEAGVCTSHACGESSCDNGIDDEGDGAIDCEDEDCVGITGCACPVDEVLPCDTPITGTTDGARNTIQNWFCSASPATGPDRTYVFSPEVTGEVTISLGDLDADLELFVSLVDEGGCVPDTCIGSVNGSTSDESLTFGVLEGDSFAVVVDGFDGASGSYTLTAACPEPAPPCSEARRIRCDRSRAGDTSALASRIDEWGCAPRRTDGPEEVFTFEADEPARVTFTLGGLEADLDLVATPDLGGSCDPGSCVASSNRGTADEQLTFDVLAGERYAVAVDGVDGATSPFELAAACAPIPEELEIEEGAILLCGCNGGGEVAWVALPLVLGLLRRGRAAPSGDSRRA